MHLLAPGDNRQRRAAVVGTFDGMHRGHRLLLDFLLLEAGGDGLQPVAVTFMSHPMALLDPGHAPRTLSTLDGRLRGLMRGGVDTVILLDFDPGLRAMTSAEFIEMLHRSYGVDLLVLGHDSSLGSDRRSTFTDYAEAGRRAGVAVVRAPRLPGVCSSAIRRALEDGDAPLAASMLGMPYAITGTVVEGRHLGRTIGWPTANVQPDDPGQLVPARGVYAARVAVEGRQGLMPAMLNIGHRPTFHDGHPEDTIEVHVIGLEEPTDLYGATVTVYFVRRLRPERTFASPQALADQLTLDRDEALQVLQ